MSEPIMGRVVPSAVPGEKKVEDWSKIRLATRPQHVRLGAVLIALETSKTIREATQAVHDLKVETFSESAELRALRAVRDAAERMSDQIGDYGEDEVCTCGLPDDTNDEMMCAFHFRASELRATLRAAKGVTK